MPGFLCCSNLRTWLRRILSQKSARHVDIGRDCCRCPKSNAKTCILHLASHYNYVAQAFRATVRGRFGTLYKFTAFCRSKMP